MNIAVKIYALIFIELAEFVNKVYNNEVAAEMQVRLSHYPYFLLELTVLIHMPNEPYKYTRKIAIAKDVNSPTGMRLSFTDYRCKLDNEPNYTKIYDLGDPKFIDNMKRDIIEIVQLYRGSNPDFLLTREWVRGPTTGNAGAG